MGKYMNIILILSCLVILGYSSIQLNLDRVAINPKQDGTPAEDNVYIYKGQWGYQKFPVNTAIDISSSSTYIIDQTCEKCLDTQVYKCEDRCTKFEKYCNIEDSMVNDGLQVQFTQNSQKQTCQTGQDVLRFGKFDIFPVSISFPFSLSGYQNFYKTIPASLGVGLKGSEQYRAVQTSFIESLQTAKFRIEQNTVSFFFGKQRALAIFGEPSSIYTQNRADRVELYSPRENPKSPLKTAPNFASLVAGIKIAEKDEIVLKDLTLQKFYNAYFSTTTKYIQLSDKELFQKIKTQIQEKANLGACQDSPTLIDCELRNNSVFPDIKLNFQIASDNTKDLASVIIRGDDYVETYQTASGSRRVLILFKLKDQLISADSVNRDQIIFGEPIFRSNFITFNHDNRRIYIQPAPQIPFSDKGLPNNWNTNLLIIGSIAIVLISTALILSFFESINVQPTLNKVQSTARLNNQQLFQTLPTRNQVVQQQILFSPPQKQIFVIQQQSPQQVILRPINTTSSTKI